MNSWQSSYLGLLNAGVTGMKLYWIKHLYKYPLGESTHLIVALLMFSNRSLNVKLSRALCFHRIRRGGRVGLRADDPWATFCHMMVTLHEAFDDSETGEWHGALVSDLLSSLPCKNVGEQISFSIILSLHSQGGRWWHHRVRHLRTQSLPNICEIPGDKECRRNGVAEASCQSIEYQRGLYSEEKPLKTNCHLQVIFWKWFSANHLFSNLKSFGDIEKKTRKGNCHNCLLLVVIENVRIPQKHDKELSLLSLSLGMCPCVQVWTCLGACVEFRDTLWCALGWSCTLSFETGSLAECWVLPVK